MRRVAGFGSKFALSVTHVYIDFLKHLPLVPVSGLNPFSKND